jgi:hypothetical protein
VVGKITQNDSQAYGFDAQTEEYVDMLQAGIIDPAKVVRAALQDAASVAGLLITTERWSPRRRRRRARRRCRAAWAVWAAWTSKHHPPCDRSRPPGQSGAFILTMTKPSMNTDDVPQ